MIRFKLNEQVVKLKPEELSIIELKDIIEDIIEIATTTGITVADTTILDDEGELLVGNAVLQHFNIEKYLLELYNRNKKHLM